MNPFSLSLPKDTLFNISSGQGVSDDVADFLLNIESNGENLYKDLVDVSSTDDGNFNNYHFKKKPFLNFASAVKPIKRKIAGKVKEVQLQKDLFGRILAISLDPKIQVDMEKVTTIKNSYYYLYLKSVKLNIIAFRL